MKRLSVALLTLAASAAFCFQNMCDAKPIERRSSITQFGTLMTVAERARDEYAAGLRVAHIDLGWRDIEPADGQWNMDAVRNFRGRIQKLRDAGLKVELGLGIHYWPRWLHTKYPSTSYYFNQWGEKAPDELNMVFSADVRREIEEYVRFVKAQFGTDFWAVRAGIDEAGEYLYPHHDKSESRRPNSFWAYDPGALGKGLPVGMRPNPLPDFMPTINEARYTNAQAQGWYAWYLDSLAGAINWQITLYERLGFKGYVKVLCPGTGLWPNRYKDILARNLNASEYDDMSRDLIARGAYFPETIPRLMRKLQVVVVTTALGNGTGDDCGCEPGDDAMDYNTGTQVNSWSSSRWVSSLARRNGFPLHAESAGHTNRMQTIDGQTGNFITRDTLQAVVHQARSCGIDVLMWAFSFRFYDPVLGQPFWPTLRDYEESIRKP